MNLRLPPFLALLVTGLALAGCMDDGGDDADGPGAGGASDAWLHLDEFPVELDHDHTNPALHDAAHGLREVAALSTGFQADQPYVNLALAQDTLLVSLGGFAGASLEPPMSLWVVDVADPAHPVSLSLTPFPGGGVESVAISDDARYGFLGTEFSGAVGIWAVDLSDRSQPVPVSFTPILPEGPHTLRYGVVDGDRKSVV